MRSDSQQWEIADQCGAQYIVDGDKNDLRFLDKPHSLVMLKAKGAAKHDRSGFTMVPPC